MKQKRLLDTKKRYQIKNKTLELQSLHRLISSTREKLEKLESQRESRFFNYQQQIYWNEEDYLKTKKALSEYKRLQELQQATASSSGNNVNQNIIKNSARIKLQDEIITNEVHLKILSAQTNRLEQSIRELESENNNKIKTSQNTSFAQKKPLVDLFKININRFENKANELASTISEKTLEIRNLAQKETSLGTKYKSYLKDFKELESLKDSKQKTLDFSLSPLEPAVFQGSPMQKIILLSFGCGLIFTTLVILIKENFSAKKSDNINTKQPFVHYGEDYREDSLQNEAQAVKGEKITPNIKISEPLIESCPEPSPALMDAGFSVDR